MARVPVIRVGEVLIASVQEDLSDRDALELESRLTAQIQATGARGVVLDLSMVEIVDSFLGRMLHDLARAARLLGAHTVVAGLQPAVAVTLVELGLELKGVRTALDAQKGLALVRRSLAAERAPRRYPGGR